MHKKIIITALFIASFTLISKISYGYSAVENDCEQECVYNSGSCDRSCTGSDQDKCLYQCGRDLMRCKQTCRINNESSGDNSNNSNYSTPCTNYNPYWLYPINQPVIIPGRQ